MTTQTLIKIALLTLLLGTLSCSKPLAKAEDSLREIQIDDYFSLKSVGSPHVSPDGKPLLDKTLVAWVSTALLSATAQADELKDGRRMTFMQHYDPQFLKGLEKHGFPTDQGYRLGNTGFVVSPFGPRWINSPKLAKAKASGRPYYMDRITGGMPFQPLDGITEVADGLKDDPNFLGFQVHEWGNSPLADYGRIHKLMIRKGLPFNKENASKYEGRTNLPFFSGGTYETYKDIFRPIKNGADFQQYLETYFKNLVRITSGQVMSVTGHMQLHHAALRLGAKNVMAEIGNQVPLSAFQIACVRGAAREYGKPFGVYYETWGGRPFGCTCATSFSPWFANQKQFDDFNDMGKVGARYGSGRSLQRRLMYFSWLSGSSYWAEEWGPENYFSNWKDYPITEYGTLTKKFIDDAAKQGPTAPITPAAIVLTADTFGLDLSYLVGHHGRMHKGYALPDKCHVLLKKFVAQVYGAPGYTKGSNDSYNLTSTPWVGCFDVFSADVAPELLNEYDVVMFLDDKQAKATKLKGPKVHVFTGEKTDTKKLLEDVQKGLPYRVEGAVGCTQARTAKGYLVGLFNNLGVMKTDKGESRDPAAKRTATVTGPCAGMKVVTGAEYVKAADDKSVKLELPAGEIVVLSFEKK